MKKEVCKTKGLCPHCPYQVEDCTDCHTSVVKLGNLKKFPELGQDVAMAEGKDVSRDVRLYNSGYNQALRDIKKLLKFSTEKPLPR